MTFASFTFTGSDGATIGSVDANWVQQTGYSSGLAAITSNRGRGSSTVNTAVYRYNSAPPGADYEVSVDLYIVDTSTSTDSGPIARASSSEQTFYMARYKPGTGIQLYKLVAGTTTQLGSTFSATYTATQTVRLRLRCSGTTIEVYRDAETSPLISVTDSSITAAGFAGIWTKTNTTVGPHLDNWDAAEVAVSSDLSGNVTLDAVAPAGTLADGGATSLSGNVTLDAVAPAGTLGATPAGYLIPALTNWGGSVQASVTVPVVTFLRLSDGVQMLTLTSQTTNGSGDISGTSGSLSTGAAYMAVGWNADGSQRFAVPITAT